MEKTNFFTSKRSIYSYIIKSLCFIVSCFTFFTTCKLGVGETVDVLPPELAITYPSPLEDVIIKDSFVIQGTVKDDIAVSSVDIKLSAKGSIAYSYGPFPAAINKDEHTWTITLNEADESGVYPIKDSLYTVTVTAKDSTGRITETTTDYEIDNTAPVVVMETPGTADTIISQVYGTKISIKGEAIDTNPDELVFTAYSDLDLSNPQSTTIPLESQAIKNELGVFENNAGSSSFFNLIYGDVFDGTKTFYYSVQASDKAKEYKGESSSGSGNVSTVYYLRNETSVIVSAVDLYNIHNGSYYTNSDGSLDEFKKADADVILAALITPSNGEPAPTIVVPGSESSTVSLINSQSTQGTQTRLGVFKLYPSTYPTYALTGVGSPVTVIPFGRASEISSAENIVIDLMPNADGVALASSESDLKNKLVIRALKLKTSILSTPSGETENFFNVYEDYYEKAYVLYPQKSEHSIGESAVTVQGPVNGRFTITTKQQGYETTDAEDLKPLSPLALPTSDTFENFKDLPFGSYILEVTGTDSTGIASGAYNNVNKYYGFRKVSNTTPPTLDVKTVNGTAPDSTTVYLTHPKLKDSETNNNNLTEDNSVIATFDGTIKAFSGIEGQNIDSVGYELTDGKSVLKTGFLRIDEGLTAVLPELEENEEPSEEDKVIDDYTWTFNLSHGDFARPIESKTYKLSITGTDVNSASSTVTYSIYYDVTLPNASITHSVMNISGEKTIQVKGTSTDNDRLESASYSVSLIDASKVETGIQGLTDIAILKPTAFTFSVLFSDIAAKIPTYNDEEHSIQIAVTIKDRAGVTLVENFIVDTVEPQFDYIKIINPNKSGEEIEDADYIDESDDTNHKNWYRSTQLVLEVDAKDLPSVHGEPVSGVETVEWTSDSGTTWNRMTKKEGLDTDTIYESTTRFETGGKKILQFRVIDKFLNDFISTDTKTIYIDKDIPTALTLVSVDNVSNVTQKLTNAKNPITVMFNGAMDGDDADINSGIYGVRLAKIGDTLFEDTNPSSVVTFAIDGTATVTITTEQIEKASKTPGGVVFNLIDNAGNIAEKSLFVLDIDNTLPSSISITSPSNNSTVNGIISVTGLANDDQLLDKVELQYIDGSGKWVNFGINEGLARGTNSWQTEVDTKILPNNSTIKIRAKATDNASNVGTSNEYSLIINQDSDRPIITLTNVTLGKDNTTTAALVGTNALTGTISDDDGSIEKFEISINADAATPTWEEVSLTGSRWTHELGEDGAKTVWFRVTDKGATTVAEDGTLGGQKTQVFTSPTIDNTASVLQNTPKLIDSSGNTYGYTDNKTLSDYSTVKMSVDTTPPIITMVYIDTTLQEINPEFDDNDDELTELSPNQEHEYGGNTKKFILQLTATDANGIRGVVGNVGSSTIAFTKTGTNGLETTFESALVDTSASNFPQGGQNLVLTVTDNSGTIQNQTIPILFDNEAPTNIEFISPEKNEQVSGIVEIIGNADDGTGVGIETMEFVIPEVTADKTSWTQPDSSSNWVSVTDFTSQAWRLTFDDSMNSENEVVYPLLGKKVITHGIEIDNSEIYYLPIVFRLTDKLGNMHITSINDYVLRVDPNGHKPQISVEFPSVTSGGIALGGTIRPFGSADDIIGVTAVYMQIDTNNDGSFDDTDKTNLLEFDVNGVDTPTGDRLYTIEDFATSITTLDEQIEIEEWWGVKITGTNAWTTAINTKGEFNPPQSGETQPIAIRFRAVDNDAKNSSSDNDGITYISLWSNTIKINVDKTAPRIGSTEPLRIVQYEDNENGTGYPISSRQYVKDMYLTGLWYLTGVIDDESNITSIQVSGGLTGDLSTHPEWFESFTSTTDPKTYGYRLKIPLRDNSSTTLSFDIVAGDGEYTTTQSIEVKPDDVAPVETKTLRTNGNEIGLDYDEATVQQSDGNFTFGAVVEDDTSGLSHVAFWFEREESNAIYNVMTGDSKSTDPESFDSIVISSEDIPRVILEDTRRTDETKFTSRGIRNNSFIRRGGLIRIGGIDRFITNVSDDTVEFTPGVDLEHRTAEFAYAMVVNNRILESQNGSNISNDDGDGMVEYVSRSGANYTWEASIDSTNIPDGPITIKYMTYDIAGNASTQYSVDTKVENNKPRLAKVYLGTDLNADGEIKEFEKVESYSTLVDGKEVSIANVNALDFTAKGLTHVTPEIVGGNGALYYKYSVKDTSVSDDSSITENAAIRTGNSENTAKPTKPMVLTLAKLKELTDDKPYNFIFTIWDSTPHTVIGESSQNAQLTLKMNVDVVDSVSPQTVIDSFYWNSETDNSLYENKRENGHIEFDALDSTTTTGLDANLKDDDPKVSGKVTFRGTAFDDKAIAEIWAEIDGFTFPSSGTAGTVGMNKVATYDKEHNTWSSTGTMSDNGWQFTVTENSLTQDGHSIEWQLDWDSQQLESVVALNKILTIRAVDTKVNDEGVHAGNVGSDTFQMDIVPYITSVTTSLSKKDSGGKPTASRTALGNYPVYSGETDIIIKGFNLAQPIDTTTTTVSGLTKSSAALNEINASVSSAEKSGNVTVSVAGIQSLNNYNSDSDWNLLVDVPNNTLNDNLLFDVWGNTTAHDGGTASLSSLELRINPDDGNIGLAFASDLYFYMPGEKYNGGDFKNTRPIERGYAGYFESALAFDPLGYPYGLTTNKDTTTPSGSGETATGGHSAFTTFYFDRVGNTYNSSTAYPADTTDFAHHRGGSYRRRLMSTSIDQNGVETDRERVVSPSMAATAGDTRDADTPSSVYLAYYDAIEDQIRFQWGRVGFEERPIDAKDADDPFLVGLKDHGFVSGDVVSFQNESDAYDFNPMYARVFYVIYNDENSFYISHTPGGDKVDLSDNTLGSITAYKVSHGNLKVSQVSGQLQDMTGSYTANTSTAQKQYGWGKPNTATIADLTPDKYSVIDTSSASTQYISIDARSDLVTADKIYNPLGDVIVVTWRAENGSLMYAYTTNPQSYAPTWHTDEVSKSAGSFNAVKIDANKSVHIAYTNDSSEDLMYAKYANYADADPTINETVDSYQGTGTQIRLDVAKTGDNHVPYISYFSSSTQTAKVAYQVNFTDSEGVIDNKFTKNWEVSHIPTASRFKNDAIGIGVYTDKDTGLLTAIPTDTVMGAAGGNNTNPVVGYITDNRTIEISQKK